jgi:fluoroacetyl-CoA thioesterase
VFEQTKIAKAGERKMEIKPGLKGESKVLVQDGNTATDFGSGSVPVLATPMLVAAMENASIKALEGFLPPEQSSVGTFIECRHLAATPKGMVVTVKAELVVVEGRRLLFRAEAYDDEEKVGEGKHERFIINLHKFLARCQSKKENIGRINQNTNSTNG